MYTSLFDKMCKINQLYFFFLLFYALNVTVVVGL